ncbi:hypothetical protein K438DRAFT_2066892, partial [Mycena galopus ATCC 62051]
EYPSDWSLDEIAHQHFLACAWLWFWSIEERGPAQWPVRVCWLRRPGAMSLPPMFDDLLDRMVLTFENHLAEYRHAREGHVDEDKLRDKLFKFVLNMEQVLFWLSRLGFWVAWSANYEQLMEWLFPNVLLQFPPVQRRAEFNCLHASMFISRCPGTQGQLGITPLDAPTGITRIYRIPATPPTCEDLLPTCCPMFLRLADRRTTLPTPPPPLPVTPPTSPPPTVPPVPPVAGHSWVSPPPRPSQSQTKKEGRSHKCTPTELRADWESGRPASSQAPPEHPTIWTPPVRAAFVPTRDPFRLPQQFPAEVS